MDIVIIITSKILGGGGGGGIPVRPSPCMKPCLIWVLFVCILLGRAWASSPLVCGQLSNVVRAWARSYRKFPFQQHACAAKVILHRCGCVPCAISIVAIGRQERESTLQWRRVRYRERKPLKQRKRESKGCRSSENGEGRDCSMR